MKLITLTLLSFLIYTKAYADAVVLDGATQKSISYRVERVTQASTLNTFNDIDLEYITITNNAQCSKKIKEYMLNLLTSKAYYATCKLHANQAIATFINYSDYKDALSEYDKTQLINQNVSIDNIDCQVQWLHNNILCVNITANYNINKAFNNMEQSNSLVKSVYVNLNTNTITELIDLCPIKLQPKFTNYLTHHKNKAYQKQTNNPIILTDLIFNIEGLLFNITENGFNTKASNGKAFSFNVNKDSIGYFLPFTLSKRMVAVNANLKPSIINKNIINTYSEYYFLQNTFLSDYLDNQKNKNKVSVYFNQSFINDSLNRLINKFTYNSNNVMVQHCYDYNTNEKTKHTIDYCYEKLQLRYSVNSYHNKKDSVAYTYNDKGFLTSKLIFEDKLKTEQINYTYDDLTIQACKLADNKMECTKVMYDVLGHSLSYNQKNEPVTITKIYANNLLMANADELYTYNANNKIEAVEKDNGRYYTNYYYNSQQQINLILYYEYKQLIKTERVAYDTLNRITSVTKLTTSNGKTQTTYSFVYE